MTNDELERKPGGRIIDPFPGLPHIGRLRIRRGSNAKGPWVKREFISAEKHQRHKKPKGWAWPKIIPPWEADRKKGHGRAG